MWRFISVPVRTFRFPRSQIFAVIFIISIWMGKRGRGASVGRRYGKIRAGYARLTSRNVPIRGVRAKFPSSSIHRSSTLFHLASGGAGNEIRGKYFKVFYQYLRISGLKTWSGEERNGRRREYNSFGGCLLNEKKLRIIISN